MLKLKALVIDDSRVMRSMVMQNLVKAELAEFEFVEAVDGVDGLAKFQAGGIDIAFVDWNMPNMTGVDFVRKVRALGAAGEVPLVMVTSEKSMGKVEEALDAAGATAYICKPFTADDLKRKLAKVIDGLAAPAKASGGGLFGKLFG